EWSVDTMGSGAAFTWMWGGEEVTLTDLTLPLEVSTNAGVQVIQLVGEELFETAAVCAAGNEVFAAVYAAPEAAVSSDTLWCEGETVSVHEAVTGEGGWTCTWSSDVGVAEGPEWTLPEGVLGNIPAVLTVTNAAGCSDTMSFNVRIDPLPQVTLSDSILMECAPFEPEVEAEISGHFGTVLSTVWTWAGGAVHLADLVRRSGGRLLACELHRQCRQCRLAMHHNGFGFGDWTRGAASRI
ncbi:hypothetical protein N9H08_00410, partial [bacterium]|nr:hypothetical protein [bacterium]